MTHEPSIIDAETPDIAEFFQRRKSAVSFDPARDVEDAQLISMLEAARLSPSCYNEQPWRFVVCRKHVDTEAWYAVFESLIDKNRAWCKNASVLVAVCAHTTFSHNDIDNPWHLYDTGAAAISAVYQATLAGLMTRQMAGFNPKLLQERFRIPDTFKVVAVMAVGHALSAAQTPNEFQQRESTPRQRKPLGEIAAFGAWGHLG